VVMVVVVVAVVVVAMVVVMAVVVVKVGRGSLRDSLRRRDFLGRIPWEDSLGGLRIP
jgi:uncharacterized membrane protein